MKKLAFTLVWVLFIGFLPLTVNANPNNTFPLAIRMAEERIARYVMTPENVLETERGRNIGWDTVELVNSRELENGRIEFTLHYSAGQGPRRQTTTWTTTVAGPKNTTVFAFGILGGENENLSAYDAQSLIDQCKEWYTNDPDYRRITDIIEREVITKFKYDWDSYLGGRSRSHQESISAGLGICDVYAHFTKDVLTAAGYRVEIWSSPGRHSWNHVIMPDGRILYIDTTWYDNEYENHPTTPAPDLYCPWYITYDKNLFERGLRGTIRMHGAWPDARRTEDGAAGIRDGTTTR